MSFKAAALKQYAASFAISKSRRMQLNAFTRSTQHFLLKGCCQGQKRENQLSKNWTSCILMTVSYILEKWLETLTGL